MSEVSLQFLSVTGSSLKCNDDSSHPNESFLAFLPEPGKTEEQGEAAGPCEGAGAPTEASRDSEPPHTCSKPLHLVNTVGLSQSDQS